jgi:hypothetical protein
MKKGMKLKTRACWLCCKQLYGNKREIIKIDGFNRVCHVICVKRYQRHPFMKAIKEIEHG